MSDDPADARYGEQAGRSADPQPGDLVLTVAPTKQTPTVGRIVHFYDRALPDSAFNHMGRGPYAAVVVQRNPGSGYVNLLVTPPFEGAFHAGSVGEGPEQSTLRYWVWPPRE